MVGLWQGPPQLAPAIAWTLSTDCRPAGASKLRLLHSCTTAGRLDLRAGMLGLVPGRSTAFVTCCPLPQDPRIVQPPPRVGLARVCWAPPQSMVPLPFAWPTRGRWLSRSLFSGCTYAAPAPWSVTRPLPSCLSSSRQALGMEGKSRDSELISGGKRSKHLNQHRVSIL